MLNRSSPVLDYALMDDWLPFQFAFDSVPVSLMVCLTRQFSSHFHVFSYSFTIFLLKKINRSFIRQNVYFRLLLTQITVAYELSTQLDVSTFCNLSTSSKAYIKLGFDFKQIEYLLTLMEATMISPRAKYQINNRAIDPIFCHTNGVKQSD